MSNPQHPENRSEFGSGVVVCLAKFSEHLWGAGAYDEELIYAYDRWLKMSETARERQRAEARRFPRGDSSEFLRHVSIAETGTRGPEETLSHLIEMWMNAASDHFYDLDVDHAPKPLRELASLTLKIGHGFATSREKEAPWTMGTVATIRRLWKESCLELDRALGVVEPDWGLN